MKKNWISISAAVTEEQKDQLNRQAEECNMSLSEYIKARLLIDQDDSSKLHGKNLNKFEKDLLSATVRTYNLIQAMADKMLSREEVKEAHQVSEKQLIEKGYK
jgi:hypothetical protein